MQTLAIIFAAIIAVFIFVYQKGRREAVEFLATTYGINPSKIKHLKGIQITALTGQLREMESRGDKSAVLSLVETINNK
jgi:hypothetical protein